MVLSILGVLFGLGVGVYGSLATPDRLASDRIRDAVRAARLMSSREGAPSAVVVEPANGEIYAVGLRAAGNWHFEDDAGTGFPVPARHDPGALVTPGVFGSALQVNEGSDLVILDLPPAADSPFGFGVEAWFDPQPEPRPMTLIERPGSWALRLDDEDQLEVSVWLDARPAPEELRRTVPEARLPAGRFTRLTLVFDGRTLQVAVDGRRCGDDTQFPSERRLAPLRGVPLRSGEGLLRFCGKIDELHLLSVTVQDREPLPPEVRLLGAPRVLRLDGFGRLDPAFHGAPEVVSFAWGEPARTTHVELSLLGAVRSWTDAP